MTTAASASPIPGPAPFAADLPPVPAPIHADERIALADLPRLADSPQAAADGFRADLLQRDRDQLARTNRLLRECLAELLPLASRRALTPADDQVIERATRVLKLGALL